MHCTDTCPADRYGQGCNETCSCVHAQSCDPYIGSCKCDIGYIGQDCSESCMVSEACSPSKTGLPDKLQEIGEGSRMGCVLHNQGTYVDR